MKLDELLAVLRLMGIDSEEVTIRRDRQVQVPCPLSPWLHASRSDEKPSMSIKVGEAEPTVFKCFACGESGKLWSLMDSYANLAKKPELNKVAEQLLLEDRPSLQTRLSMACEGVKEWIKPTKSTKIKISSDAMKHMPSVSGIPSVCAYLRDRQIPERMWSKFDLRYDPREDRVVFPVKDADGDLVGAVGRIMPDADGVKYRNYLGFRATMSLGGINRLSSDFTSIIVVEGWICLTHAWEWAEGLGSAIVCTWHAEMSEQQADQLISLDKPVSIWYDNDTAGNKGWLKSRDLLAGRVSVKRAAMEVDRDVGRMTRKEFVDTRSQLKKELGYVR